MEDTNKVQLIGVLSSPLKIIQDTSIYRTLLDVVRISNAVDRIPLDIPERLVKSLAVGDRVRVTGRFISLNKSGHCQLSVYVCGIAKVDTYAGIAAENNIIELDGHICKPPVYRRTPLGREITDMHVAVNHPYRRSYYIPCIAWEKNARIAGNCSQGDRIVLRGRIQSREYVKQLRESAELRTAYEVSIGSLEIQRGTENEKCEIKKTICSA